MSKSTKLITDIRHPNYYRDQFDWNMWRLTYEGGNDYTIRYLKKFSNRETDADFTSRRDITPVPAFAKAAVNDIRNAIFQRMRDVVRRGGSKSYQEAVEGLNGGVDMRGTNMTAFMGYEALTELLIMGKVGIYVDMPVVSGQTLADTKGVRPYLYMYPIEDILSWRQSHPDDASEYSAVLLRDRMIEYCDPADFDFDLPESLPSGTVERFRYVYVDPVTKLVNVQFYNADGEPTDREGIVTQGLAPIELELTRIPFIILDIGESVLKDVCKHQIALLNLGSSDVAYALKANFPFYTEQRDLRAVGDHLKHAAIGDGTATSGGQPGADNEIKVGATHGRAYDLRAERPGFIHPSPEPLEASIKLQEKLEDDIRKLVNLAVANKIGRPISAEAKDMDNQGLEAGLSFIGLVLENGERKLAEFWAAYEERVQTKRQIPTIKYPDRYSLKSDLTRLDEAKKLSDLMYAIPGHTVKRELARAIVASLLGGKVSVDTLETIYNEIEKANYTTSDPDIILQAREQGLCGEQTASIALGFDENEYKQAQQDHLARIERIAKAQTVGFGQAMSNPAARGLADLSDNPSASAKAEKVASRDTTLQDSTKVPVRGKGKSKEGE